MAKEKPPRKPPTPKAPKPWDVKPILDSGDEHAEPLFLAVGTALTMWERLDTQLGWLFGTLVSSRQGAAETAFGMIQSPSGRASMVLAAAQRVLPAGHELLVEITQIVPEIGQLAGRRNDIAHGIVSQFSSSVTDANGGSTNTSWGHFLIPGHTNTRKQLSQEAFAAIITEDWDAAPQRSHGYAYTAAQVHDYVEVFATYHKRLSGLVRRVHAYCREQWPPQLIAELQFRQQIADLQTKLTALEGAPPPQQPQE